MMPLNGWVFALDGILFGAGDLRFMRNVTAAGALLGYLPLTLATAEFGWGLTGIWVGISTFIWIRAAIGFARWRGRRWLVGGVRSPTRPPDRDACQPPVRVISCRAEPVYLRGGHRYGYGSQKPGGSWVPRRSRGMAAACALGIGVAAVYGVLGALALTVPQVGGLLPQLRAARSAPSSAPCPFRPITPAERPAGASARRPRLLGRGRIAAAAAVPVAQILTSGRVAAPGSRREGRRGARIGARRGSHRRSASRAPAPSSSTGTTSAVIEHGRRQSTGGTTSTAAAAVTSTAPSRAPAPSASTGAVTSTGVITRTGGTTSTRATTAAPPPRGGPPRGR